MKNKLSAFLAAGTTLLAVNAAAAPIYTATSVSISYTSGTIQTTSESISFQGPGLNIMGSGLTIFAPLFTTPPNTPFSLTLGVLVSDTGSNPASGTAGGVPYTNLNLDSGETPLWTFGPFVLPTGVFSAHASEAINGTVFACPANLACDATSDLFAITFNLPVNVTIGATQIAANGYAITSASVTTAPEPSTGLLSAGACALLLAFFVRKRRPAVLRGPATTPE